MEVFTTGWVELLKPGMWLASASRQFCRNLRGKSSVADPRLRLAGYETSGIAEQRLVLPRSEGNRIAPRMEHLVALDG